MIAVDARDRRLAGRIDLGDDDVSASLKQVQNSSNSDCSRVIAMRLHHGDDPAAGGFARRLQHGGDLDRVMAVIVDDGDAVPFAGLGEAALHPAEAGERLADGVVGQSAVHAPPRSPPSR